MINFIVLIGFMCPGKVSKPKVELLGIKGFMRGPVEVLNSLVGFFPQLVTYSVVANGEMKFVTKEVTPYRCLGIHFGVGTNSISECGVGFAFEFTSYYNGEEEKSVETGPEFVAYIGHILVLDRPFFPVLNKNPSNNLSQSFIFVEEKAFLITFI